MRTPQQSARPTPPQGAGPARPAQRRPERSPACPAARASRTGPGTRRDGGKGPTRRRHLRLRVAAATVASAALAAAAAVTTGSAPTAEAAPRRAPAAGPAAGNCAAGQFCTWQRAGFGGARRSFELSDTPVDSCVPLPHGATAASLANRTGRHVTAYQSVECAETGEFDTYPGGGSWVPQSPYQVRAFKVWEQ